MWIRSWRELQSGEVGGCETTAVSRREGKGDSGCVEAFWDDYARLEVEWMEYNLYYYDSIYDAVVMKDKEDNKLVIECTKANAQVIFDEPEDEGYLVRLAREEPANYVSYALISDGLQGYVDAMNVFN